MSEQGMGANVDGGVSGGENGGNGSEGREKLNVTSTKAYAGQPCPICLVNLAVGNQGENLGANAATSDASEEPRKCKARTS